VGLPAALEGDGEAAGHERAPLVGSWWVRSCTTTRNGSELSVNLAGPGWYWVDAEQDGFTMHQQVGLELSAELAGTLQAGFASGIVSVWFRPSREPIVEVRASRELELQTTNARGALLKWLAPGLARTNAARSISERATSRMRSRLTRGITVTYDIWRDQHDLALAHLDAGEVPVHPFAEKTPWIVNERMLLAPGATQMFGPLAADTPHRLDTATARGLGIEYRALCTRDMPAHFSTVVQGVPERLPARAVIGSGKLLGGQRAVRIAPQHCPFYLVASGVGGERSLVDIRLAELESF